ncbi:MAG: hypothetical protein ACYC61_04935 [Isosphaeraceae bacterium]
MDPRIDRAQRLYWDIYGAGTTPRAGCLDELMEMAELHEGIARDRLDRGDGTGWIDWYAALTALGDAGRIEDARRLVAEGRRRADAFLSSKTAIERELSEFESWLRTKTDTNEPAPPRPQSSIPTRT